MFECAVCGFKQSRSDVVDEVFEIHGDYVLVERIPLEICVKCGERSVSLETAETVRRAVSSGVVPSRLIEMRVFEFESTQLAKSAAEPSRDSGKG
jgi:YgiT-type zinc finger domain-containing protein